MRRTKRILFSLILMMSLCLAACGKPAENVTMDSTGKYVLNTKGEAIINDVSVSADYTATNNNRVMYEIFVGSFSDSNGDGIGDIRGIINRLDYLNDGDPDSGESLGVEGLWLSPIFKSPSYHKYDVMDYYTIDSDFGTTDDLWELIELCHQRGMIVILDLPINHTSNLNSMYGSFVTAHRKGDTESKYYDYYTYLTADQEKPAGRTFATVSGTTDLYECNFSSDMPELNFDNENVRKEVLEIAKYYLNLGVDGFRFDAARYIYYGDNTASVEFWNWYIAELKKVKSDIYTVGEVWDNDAAVKKYYQALDCFDFAGSSSTGIIADVAKGSSASRYTNYVESFYSAISAIRSDSIYMPFVGNHDLDRSAGFLSVENGQMQMAAQLYLLSPGSPYIYYGEEIGMKGSRGSANTDANRRLAMLWGDDDTIKNPEGSSYSTDKQINGTLSDQLGKGDSLYNVYKKLIMIRKAYPEIASGSYVSLKISEGKLGGFTSTLNGSTVCVLHNTSASESYSIDLSTVTGFSFEKIAACVGAGASLEGTSVTLEPQTSVVLVEKNR